MSTFYSHRFQSHNPHLYYLPQPVMVAQSLPGSMMPPSANMTIAPSYAARTRSAPANSNSGNSNSKPKRDSQRPLTHEEEAELERKKEHSRAKARERYRKMSSDRKAKKLAYTRTYHHNLTPEQQARYRRNQAIRNKEKKMTQHIVKSQQLHQEHHDEVQGYQFMQLSQHQQEFPVPLESVYKAVPVAKTETADSAVVAAAAVLVSPPAQHRTQDSNSPPWHAQVSSPLQGRGFISPSHVIDTHHQQLPTQHQAPQMPLQYQHQYPQQQQQNQQQQQSLQYQHYQVQNAAAGSFSHGHNSSPPMLPLPVPVSYPVQQQHQSHMYQTPMTSPRSASGYCSVATATPSATLYDQKHYSYPSPVYSISPVSPASTSNAASMYSPVGSLNQQHSLSPLDTCRSLSFSSTDNHDVSPSLAIQYSRSYSNTNPSTNSSGGNTGSTGSGSGDESRASGICKNGRIKLSSLLN